MLELWGGHECTVNRIGDVWRDQTVRSGHQTRLSDLALFADLGLRALRYPILWERVAPDDPQVRDWSWSDERLAEIRRLGMRPIAGLLHHGSGPHYTSLISDNFVQGLAEHARATAERYPWITDWTPVNEPLTTARFSGLYGHWYPHARDEKTFWLALLNEVDGTRAAMAEIRKIVPGARLIQTEDLGQAYGTEPFAEEVAFQNLRRWSTWDLLTGRVTPDHALWPRLAGFGLAERLAAIAAAPCPPDVLGINFYITSERFLDHRAERYPQWTAGEMGQFDMDALRVLDPRPAGLEGLLQQAWDRYGLPIAVTESHLNGTREEQMRWTAEAWALGLGLRDQGVDFRAVTIWALLGSFDWNSLLTRDAGFYEAGAFDIRSGTPRPTAMVGMLKRLASGEDVGWLMRDPVLGDPGWWRREIRLSLPIHRWGDAAREPLPPTPRLAPVLIVSGGGALGAAFAQACTVRGLRYVLTRPGECDPADPNRLALALATHKPWAVIHAAGWTDVDAAEVDRDACFAANLAGPLNLALACAEAGLHLTVFSDALVFDGTLTRPYLESDTPAPLNVYGVSLAEAEQVVAATLPTSLIVRTGALFCADDAGDVAGRLVASLGQGRPVLASAEHIVSPTYVPDLVDACLNLVIDGATGLHHLSQATHLSGLAFAQTLAAAAGLDPAMVHAATPAELGWRAERPRNAGLGSSLGALLPPLDDALARFGAIVAEARARTPRRRGYGVAPPQHAMLAPP